MLRSPSMANLPPPDLVGAVLSSRFRLVRHLGSGGMGTVYEAHEVNTGERFAAKILHNEYLADMEVVQRFVEEGIMGVRLVHPNIVRVFETTRAENGRPYMVMELLEGAPLSTYTRAGTRLPMPQAVTVLQGVLAGLGAAHVQGVVHRDLKPENVFLARSHNGQIVPKILDFGIAKVMDLAGGMGNKTATGMLLGTPAYMSPEQITNAKAVDARSDLFSAGSMFYEMLTGRVAFPAPTEYARLSAVISENPTPIESHDPAFARFATFVGRALEKKREQRFGSALEMAQALAASAGNIAQPMPMSQLPGVASLLMPSRVSAAPPPMSGPTEPIHVTPPEMMAGPTGTLASPPARHRMSETPPRVVFAAQGGTLPSEDLPMFERAGRNGTVRIAGGGVPAGVVVAFVLAALVAGFFLGFVVARHL